MRLILLFLAATLSAMAQVDTNAPPSPNYAIKFYGTNSFGIPTNWPSSIQTIGTNTEAGAGWSVFTQSQLDNLLSTNKSAFVVANSNRNYSVASNTSSNYALWLATYNQMPQGIADSSDRIGDLKVAFDSFRSGTNTASGTNAIIRTMLDNTRYSFVYLNQIIKYLSRLGPGLQQIYQPSIDPVGH